MQFAQVSQSRPCCRSCWFRQSRPRRSRHTVRARCSHAENRLSQTGNQEKGSSFNAQTSSSAQSSDSSLTRPTAAAPQHSEAERLTAYGDSQARAEESLLLTAVDEVRQSQAAHSGSPPAQQQQAPPQQQAASADTQSSQQHTQSSSQARSPSISLPNKSLSKADMLAKLAQAKAYKQDKSKQGGAPVILDTPVILETQSASHKTSQASPQPKDSFSSTQRTSGQPPGASDQRPTDQQQPESQTGFEGKGSAAQPARFLEAAMQKQSEDSKKMSAEAYSLLKEQQKRNQKVDIISVDKSYNKGDKVMDPNYNPKVATWGVFERPANISEAYGGGRTIKAGTPLEDATATQARKDRIAAALSRYKRDAALEIVPAVQQRCEVTFAEGEELFHNKQVAPALLKYAVAAELMPVKTALGGRARLQQAICLDSLGQNKEAYAVYLLLQTHPLPEVAKQAKRMIFGFKAMDNLKAHTISYSVSKGAYEQYFNRFTGDWNSVYVSTDENSTDLTKTAIIALAVMLAPLLFVAAKILL